MHVIEKLGWTFSVVKFNNYFMHPIKFRAQWCLSFKSVALVLTFASANFLHAQTTESHSGPANQGRPGHGNVSPTLYGLMTEEINYSYEGGLYGELIRNRTFKANPANAVFWDAIGGAAISLDTNQPLNTALEREPETGREHGDKKIPAGIANGGYWGIPGPPEDDLSRLVLREGGRGVRRAS